jgi:hypothetical protein
MKKVLLASLIVLLTVACIIFEAYEEHEHKITENQAGIGFFGFILIAIASIYVLTMDRAKHGPDKAVKPNR